MNEWSLTRCTSHTPNLLFCFVLTVLVPPLLSFSSCTRPSLLLVWRSNKYFLFIWHSFDHKLVVVVRCITEGETRSHIMFRQLYELIPLSLSVCIIFTPKTFRTQRANAPGLKLRIQQKNFNASPVFQLQLL